MEPKKPEQKKPTYVGHVFFDWNEELKLKILSLPTYFPKKRN